MSYDLNEYTAFYSQNPEEEGPEKILSSKFDTSGLTELEKDLFRRWLPNTSGDFLIQAVRVELEDIPEQDEGEFKRHQDVIKQTINGIWNPLMQSVIPKLEMRPDHQDPYSLMNQNIEEVKNTDIDDGEWQITNWRTRITESIDNPFEATNATPEEGNLLCDEVVFTNTNDGREVRMFYGWNAYISKN